MPKIQKTKSELAEMMMQEARNRGKCDDLGSVVIMGPLVRGDANWDFGTPTGRPLVKPECQNELRAIASRLQREFDLSGD